MAQLAGTYTEQLPTAFEGLSGDGATDLHVRSMVNPNDATPWGRAALQLAGVGDNEFAVSNAGDGTFVGVTQHSHYIAPSTVPLATDAAPATETVNIKTKGRIWVRPETTIAALNAPVYYRHSNAGADPEGLGRFRSDDDAASGDVTLVPATQARWRSTTSNPGELALLEVNLP